MDRRQRKTREAIFSAFAELLAAKEFGRITVAEIIERADVGRATFYAHFETKDYLLKELCGELFCHILDAAEGGHKDHRHIFRCGETDSVFLHLFRHLMNNDNGILGLLTGRNNEIFLQYFRNSLTELAEKQAELFDERRNEKLPQSFWTGHIASVFTDTVRWWIENGMKESPETLTEYFFLAV